MADKNKYPHPSTLNVGNFVSIKLSENNYQLRKTQVLGLIESQDMMGFIDGDFPAPKEKIEAPDSDSSGKKEIVNPEFSLWKRSDRLLHGWITGTLSEDTLSLVVGLDISNVVWTTLNDSCLKLLS
ncbi:hypothetical protein POM88_053369 [Heracleum sosnowskyi]|uniref:Uncharacterized protein n=1 Tax=Heracleum sosnowskyi TaxID=360622 RepID=A0AAD8GP47_9APIA|nr:hypothetical protein POM88_053369 [Heracleum sosnowskyi]